MAENSLKNLFLFNESLPEPFASLAKRSSDSKCQSVLGNGRSTLFAPLTIAILHYYHGSCAVGRVDKTQTVSEWPAGDKTFLISYKESGAIQASVYDNETAAIERFSLNGDLEHASSMFAVLFPTLMRDPEFELAYMNFAAVFGSGYPSAVADAAPYLYVMCENTYRRLKDDSCSNHVPLDIDKSGNIFWITATALSSGKFRPQEELSGTFHILSDSEEEGASAQASSTPLSEFVGRYKLSSRMLNPEEQALVPRLPSWYLVPQEVQSICLHAQKTTGKAATMRNFMLRGPAGTGKTMGAVAVAAGLGLPYCKYTCSAGTEIFDLIGQMLPQTDSSDSLGELDLPDLDDMEYDPSCAYRMLTGQEKEDATPQDCVRVALKKALAYNSPEKTAQQYRYVESDLIKALRFGWVVEIQEPTTIVQPGVLVGLNSLLEQGGSVTLPTGQIVHRHPDAVVIITTNVDYEGCRNINQSVIDRMSLILDMPMPSKSTLVDRAISVTGYSDREQVEKMVRVLSDAEEYLRQSGITDGAIGFRGLVDWINSTQITGDAYQSAKSTIISRATNDPDEQKALMTAVLDPIIPEMR